MIAQWPIACRHCGFVSTNSGDAEDPDTVEDRPVEVRPGHYRPTFICTNEKCLIVDLWTSKEASIVARPPTETPSSVVEPSTAASSTENSEKPKTKKQRSEESLQWMGTEFHATTEAILSSRGAWFPPLNKPVNRPLSGLPRLVPITNELFRVALQVAGLANQQAMVASAGLCPSASQPIYELLKVTLSKALERMAAAGPDNDKPYNIAIIVPSDAVPPNEPLYHVTRTGQTISLHLPAGVQSDSIVNMARNVDTLEWEFKTRSNRSDEGDWTLL